MSTPTRLTPVLGLQPRRVHNNEFVFTLRSTTTRYIYRNEFVPVPTSPSTAFDPTLPTQGIVPARIFCPPHPRVAQRLLHPWGSRRFWGFGHLEDASCSAPRSDASPAPLLFIFGPFWVDFAGRKWWPCGIRAKPRHRNRAGGGSPPPPRGRPVLPVLQEVVTQC